jgi:dihydrofolate synthase/folylpolyglutamate synthase
VPISREEFAGDVRELRTVTEKLITRRGGDVAPSYFEFMTALAFLHFVRAGCDVVVIEVGMGGRLDATNVIRPEVSAITSIGLDHQEFLGPTIEAIAAEKAGIVKPRTPVVIGRLPATAERVVRGVAAQQDAPVISVFETFGDDIARYPVTNLAGDCQRVNAATAALIARTLDAGWAITDSAITTGLAHVNWSARWHRLRVGGRTVIIDAAHNEEGAWALAQNLANLSRSGPKPIVVAGVLGSSRAKPVLAAIAPHAAEIRLVVPRQRRACSHDELAALVPEGFTGPVVRTSLDEVFPRLGACLPTVPRSQPVVITGSVYLAGEALARIDPTLGPVEHELQDF